MPFLCNPGMPAADESVIHMVVRLEQEAWHDYVAEKDPNQIWKRKLLWEHARDRRERWQVRLGQSGEFSALSLPICWGLNLC